jgi:hypothetical protein
MALRWRTRLEWGRLWTALLAAAWLCFRLAAFSQVVAPETSVSGALASLASRAGVAFTGRVAKIERTGDVVDVTFDVEESMIGSVGATYTLREWAGLWPPGSSRFSMGERVAIFLNAPNAAGMSSPVDGADGVVPVVQVAANQPVLLDVRRLAARVQRAVGQPIAGEADGAVGLEDVKTLIASSRRGVQFELPRRPLPPGIVAPAAPKIPFFLESIHNGLQLPLGVAR